jgi:hypothetical protein
MRMSKSRQAKVSIDAGAAGAEGAAGATGSAGAAAADPAAGEPAAAVDATIPPERPNRNPSAPPPGNELRQRLDQVGTILAKGLDLAEAGVSLGMTIISRVGVAAQQRFREGMEAAAAPGQPPATQAVEAEQHSRAATSAPPPEPESTYGITNRLPLTPGGTVNVSFSINNESMMEPKRVELRVEGFLGDAHGARLDAATFTVEPSQMTIAPVDFEKFRLRGPVPADALCDVYRGAVIVASGTELRIPVVLVVMQL